MSTSSRERTAASDVTRMQLLRDARVRPRKAVRSENPCLGFSRDKARAFCGLFVNRNSSVQDP